jgi:flagellar motor switch protein FliN/FliY
MSTPHDVISELLSAAAADTLQATGESAWQSASDALAGIFETAPELEDLEARLVMPDEIIEEFAVQHLVLPVEATTKQDQSANAWLVVATVEAARFLNSEADNADDQEQQTIVMASTVLGQAIRSINSGTFGESSNGLILSLDDVTADSMPGILTGLEDPCLVLTGTLSGRAPAKVWLVLPGGFLDIIATGFQGEGAPREAPAAVEIAPAAAAPVAIAQSEDDAEESAAPTPIGARRQGDERNDGRTTPEPTPLRNAPTAHRAQFGPVTGPETPYAPANIDLLAGLEMNISVELGRTEMTVSEVLSLGPGSVVELDRLAGEPVDILVNDRLIARGEVVVVDENFGVRVVEVVRRREEATG